MPKKVHTPEMDTALHVVKGAIAQVLGTPVTRSTSYNSKKNGRVAVVYESEVEPTDAQRQEVEKLANATISKAIAVKETKCSRVDAEKAHGSGIYDHAPIPDTVTEVTVVQIEGCTVNCCPGPHAASTADVGPVTVPRINFRPQKKEVEFIVNLGDGGAAQSKSKAKKGKVAAKESTKAAGAAPTLVKCPTANQVAADILAEVAAYMEAHPGCDAAQVKASISAAVAIHLSGLKNAAYTAGFQAARAANAM